MVSLLERVRPKLFIQNKLLKGALSEFFGTFLLCLVGVSVVAQFFIQKSIGRMDLVEILGLPSFLAVNIGWGFAIMFCVFVGSKVSGGHVNPAVTWMLFSFGLVDIVTALVYTLSQILGAFFGSACVYLLYWDAIKDKAFGPVDLAPIFTSMPMPYLSVQNAYLDQVIGTGILCLFIAAIFDDRNKIPEYLRAMFTGFVVIMIGCAFGHNLGYPINSARDLGPRVFIFLVTGFKAPVFTRPYFLITFFAPLISGIIGGWLYYLCIGFQIPEEVVVVKVHVDETPKALEEVTAKDEV